MPHKKYSLSTYPELVKLHQAIYAADMLSIALVVIGMVGLVKKG
jgi:hypothetical protein